MQNNDEVKTVNIKISDGLIKEETEDKIRTRVPRTYDDKERYLILNQNDVEEINNGVTLLATLEKDKIYNLVDKIGDVVEQLNGEQLANKYYDPVPQRKKTVAEETVFEEENETKTDKENTSQQSQEKKDSEQTVKLSHSVLDSKHTKFEVKRAKLEDRNSKLQEKIKKAETKIEKWQAKKEESQEALKHCQKLLDIPALPAPVMQFLKMYAESKENKIGSLNNKMGSKRKKVDISNDKITKNTQKIARIEKKLNKLERIDTFLNNMHSPQGRRENFVNGLQEFRKSSLVRSRSKLTTLDNKIEKAQKAFETTHSAEDKVKLRNTLQNYSEQRKALEEKIEKLENMNKKLEAVTYLPDKRAEEIVTESCENISSSLKEKQDITANQAVDEVLNISEETIDKTFAKIKEEPSQDIENKLKEAISYDIMYYGVLTDQTVNFIKQAGYTYNNGELELSAIKKEVKEEANVSTEKSSEDKQEKKSSPLSRDTIKSNAAKIKAKEAKHEAPKQLKSQGQEL